MRTYYVLFNNLKLCHSFRQQCRNYLSNERIKLHRLQQSRTLSERLFNYLYRENVHFLEGSCTNSRSMLQDILQYTDENINTISENLIRDKNLMKKLDQIDRRTSEELHNYEVSSLFVILGLYMILVPNRIVQYGFYTNSLHYLTNKLNDLSLNEKIQLIFYIGHQKKTKFAQRLLKQCVMSLSDDDVDEFTINDLCIVSNATFKANIKLPRYLSNKLLETIENNLHVLNDVGVFVTLLKTIRLNRLQNEDFLDTISATIIFNATYKNYTFGAICHILAAYSDSLYYVEKLFTLLRDECIKHLHDPQNNGSQWSYEHNYIKAKDITRFLWCFSYIGLKFDNNVLIELEDLICHRILNGKYDGDPGHLLDTIYYLWSLNYQAEKLIKLCFKEKNIQFIRDCNNKAKFRLNSLLTCIQIENLELYKSLNFKPNPIHYINVKHHMQQRPVLCRIHGLLKEIAKEFDVNRLELECQVPHLNVIGITAYRKNIYKAFIIEVIDDYVKVRNTTNETLSGPMQLKLRLVEAMKQNVIIIRADDIQNMSNPEIQDDLRYEINMCSLLNNVQN